MELQRGLGVLTSPCAAPKGAQILRESLPSTPLPQFARERRTGDPAACWAILSPSRFAGLDCRYVELDRRPGIRA